ncbi:MAG: Arc family DNA-binding protein [Oscillospiraceae bacterium]|nr:Arc family DNA-binding protein [Oscillospiraceae bacterium]
MYDIDKQLKRQSEFNKTNYDKIGINVYKGNREKLKELASIHGQSMNDYIIQAIEERVTRDGDEWENKKMM